MKPHKYFDFIPFGGDYNPDQWSRDVWSKDMNLLTNAGVNFLTLPVFSWAKLQPSENEYQFSWLDDVLDVIAENGMKVCLATPTAAQPAWMSLRYPDILPVDIQGRKRVHGKRINFCPNSSTYRRFAAAITEQMTTRYREHPALAMWHISNEYGTLCYCDTCATEFRHWLERRYRTVNNLNERWNLAFWGHTIYSWDEVTVPSRLNDDDICNPAKSLDYMRFMTDSIIGCYQNEREIVRHICPGVPATTNITGFIKILDQSKIAQYVDVVGWDNYPSPSEDLSSIALKHDIMRGLKHGAPYFLMEQSPNQQNWQPYNVLKRPGEVRRLSYQALCHGADAILFFQMRANRGGVEKFHGAFISQDGRNDTRIYREMAQLGKELKTLGETVIGATTKARVAIIFEWDSWWAVELSSGPSCDLKYFEQVQAYYTAFYRQNISVDIIRAEADLSEYDIVIAPVLYMLTEAAAENLSSFVAEGGILVSTFFSGIVDEHDLITPNGLPGLLRPVMGIRVEEIDALPRGKTNTIILNKAFMETTTYSCSLLCEIIHSEGAEILATYGKDFYAGSPCLTRFEYGKGIAYYVATAGESRFIQNLLSHLCTEKGVTPVLDASDGIEVAVRNRDNRKYIFVINHSAASGTVKLGKQQYTDLLSGKKVSNILDIAAGDVHILEPSKK